MGDVIKFVPRGAPVAPKKTIMPPIENLEELQPNVFQELCTTYDSADEMLDSVLKALLSSHRVDLSDDKHDHLRFFLRDFLVACVLAQRDIFHPMHEVARDFYLAAKDLLDVDS